MQDQKDRIEKARAHIKFLFDGVHIESQTLTVRIEQTEKGVLPKVLFSGHYSWADIALENDIDGEIYIAQQTFNTRWRNEKNIAEIVSLYTDIDYRNSQYADKKPWQVLQIAKKLLRAQKLPMPSAALFTGRGICLIWKLAKYLDGSYLRAWKQAQSVLGNALRGVGSDTRAKGASQFFRLAGSVNLKSNKIVEFLELNSDRYSLPDFYIEAKQEAKKLVNNNLHKQEQVVQKEAVKHRAKTANSEIKPNLWTCRLEDLERLHLCFPNSKIPAGRRNPYMFILHTCYAWTGDHRFCTASGLEHCEGTCTKDHLRYTYANLEKRRKTFKLYRMKTQTIREQFLGLSVEFCQAHNLKYLLDKTPHKFNREGYLESIRDNGLKEKVIACIDAGLSIRKTAELLNISKSRAFDIKTAVKCPEVPCTPRLAS